MSEQLTRITGRMKPLNDAPFFVANVEDIDAAELQNSESEFPKTSLKNYLSNLQEQILEKPIEITNFSAVDIETNNKVAILEKGDSRNIILTWATSQTPSCFSLDGELLDSSITSYNKGLVKQDQRWTLTAFDFWGNESLPKEAYVFFYNKIYYGSLSKDIAITDEIIQGMNGTISNTYNISFSVQPNKDEYIYFIAPKNLEQKTPEFSINNLIYEWDFIQDITYTNIFGHTEDYGIWRHPQLIEDNITVNVIGKGGL